MSITMRLSGGLGNQLHQLAAGVAIAGEKKTALTLDRRSINLGSNSKRTFELDYFDFSNLMISMNYIGEEMQLRSFGLRLLNRLGIRTNLDLGDEDFKESKEDVTKQMEKIENNDVISGHFVDFAWVTRAEKFGFRPLVKKEFLTPKIFELQSEILENDVGIHLRYGDFLKHPNLFPKVDDEYIEEALSYISKVNRIWIFTDDLINARKLCGKTFNQAYRVFGPQELSSVDTFWLFGQFSKMVTSNSTFSCWSSYLTSQSNPTVITPIPHLLNDWKDSLPKNWIRVQLKTYNPAKM